MFLQEERNSKFRAKIQNALQKPQAPCIEEVGQTKYFNPWQDLIHNIYGHYSLASDEIMISALCAVRDRRTFEFIEDQGFAAEFVLYVIAGNDLTEYGTSPRAGFPNPAIADLWQDIIDKWTDYIYVAWSN